MGKSNWRERAGTPFTCEKQPAHGKSGMVVTNHPLASAAGMEMLAAGGNAVDAAVAAQFALTVVEPMMVGLIGGTTMHVRLAGGHHTIIDGMSAVPAAGHPKMYQPDSGRASGGLRRRGPGQSGRAEIGRHARLAARLVPRPRPIRDDVARRRDAARDPARQPRLRRHALSFRLHRRCVTRPAAGSVHRRPPAARRRPAEARRAPGAGRLRRGADPDFPAGRTGAAWRAAGRSRRRVHGTLRRLRRPKRSHRLSRGRAQADPRPVSRLGNRRTAAARRLGRAYHADAEHPRRTTTSPGSASARWTASISWPKS